MHYHVSPDDPRHAGQDGASFAEFSERLQKWLSEQPEVDDPEVLLTGDGQLIMGMSYRGCPVSLTANITE